MNRNLSAKFAKTVLPRNFPLHNIHSPCTPDHAVLHRHSTTCGPCQHPIYRKRKKFRGEIISLYSRAPLHRENIVCEMSPCFSRVTLLLAVDSLWTFAVTSRQFVEMLYQAQRDHSLQQSRDRPSQKQTSRYKKWQSRKPRRRGARDTMSTM